MKKLILTIAIIASSFASFAQVGIGTTSTHASAVLEISSTTKGFLPPRMTSAQLVTLKGSSPAEGLIIYCTDCDSKSIVVFNGHRFVGLIGTTAPPTVVEEVNSPTGKTWMDRNLGASQAATAYDDQRSYGNYYQWGNLTTAGSGASINGVWDTSDGFTADTNWSDGASKGLQDPCPTDFRIPTETEWEAERDYDGVGSWGTGSEQNNNNGAFASVLKLSSGSSYRKTADGSLSNDAVSGYYWSSTVIGVNSAKYFLISSTDTVISTASRSVGFSVRCIKD